MSNQSNQSKIEINFIDGVPVATITYKGQFLMKSKFKRYCKTMIERKPVSDDNAKKPLEERMMIWKNKVANSLAKNIARSFKGTIYNELSNTSVVSVDFEGAA